MLKGSRAQILAKGFALAVIAGVGLWSVGCTSDNDDRQTEHAGWHERGSNDNRYDNNNHDPNYDRNYDNYNQNNR